MELCNQLKKHRAQLGLSQDALAEKIFVSRQTVSNWENEKSYPDIHSLILLSNVFGISIDELIKGDIEVMKNTINQEDIRTFNCISWVFTVMLMLCLLLPVPLVKFGGLKWFLIIYLPLYIATMAIAIRVENFKSQHNIQTYKEIVAFMKGESLDMIAKKKEQKKVKWQVMLSMILSAAAVLVIAAIWVLILR